MKKLFATMSVAALAMTAAAQVTELPTMGWSSWNTFALNINDSLIMQQADAMAKSGLKDAGYQFINIDDGYFGGRDKQTGRMLVHAQRFPQGLQPVVDHIHALGLKAGIYSDAGMNTCGNYWGHDTIAYGVGLYGHEQQDCDMFFKEYGFDFIKVDFCGGESNGNVQRLAVEPQERYTIIANAIRNTGRKDVRMNVCRWDYPGTWVNEQALSWRMSHDISCNWKSVKDIIDQSLYLSPYCADGHYNDMDMLEVGRTLTPEEDRTHFGLWCIFSSPLLIGCDMTKLTPEALELLTNKELIALNQDPLGLQAYVVKHDQKDDTYVFVKDILTRHGLSRAVALYNPNDEAKVISIAAQDVELSGEVTARDLFEHTQTTLPRKSQTLTREVPAHGCRIFKLTGTQRLERTRYEAENAWLTGYQEIYNADAIGTAYYKKDPLCSGGMKVVNLGYRAANDIQWRDVWSNEGGKYKITVKCVDLPKEGLVNFSVNGGSAVRIKVEEMKDNTFSATFELKKGLNTVRVCNDHQAMPDIDYMELAPAN